LHDNAPVFNGDSTFVFFDLFPDLPKVDEGRIFGFHKLKFSNRPLDLIPPVRSLVVFGGRDGAG